MTRVFSYIVTHDSGFSPNPFHGVCTLACCKPMIRRAARVGDLIVGLTSGAERVVYAMRASRALDFRGYWDDPQYGQKRPDITSSLAVVRRGDNIYQPFAIGEFKQLHSQHSKSDGSEDINQKRTDLGGLHVLVAERYTYFGENGPPLPSTLEFLRVGRGHRCRFTEEQVARVLAWFERLAPGIHGRPAQWPRGDTSWNQSKGGLNASPGSVARPGMPDDKRELLRRRSRCS